MLSNKQIIIYHRIHILSILRTKTHLFIRGVQWPSGRASDSGARGQRFETYLRRVVSLSKIHLLPGKVLVVAPS